MIRVGLHRKFLSSATMTAILSFMQHFLIFRFFCECNRGYEPDNSKSKCVDVNECDSSNGGCNNPNQQCVNIPGSHYCSCSLGFKSSDKL